MISLKEFDKSKHLLNYEKMDNLHMEFLDIYNSVNLNSIDSIKSKSMELLIHTKKHFSEEEKLMHRYDYPRIKEHKDEHEKVLAELEFFIKKSHSIFGMNILKSYYLEKLPHWFDFHLLSMDSDLTAHLNNFGLKKAKLQQEMN
ncbi:MAG: hemerythrin family protein [Aliarcobacter sp.]|nr:hemerythrin family protein [Aliarcobacter sp.]